MGDSTARSVAAQIERRQEVGRRIAYHRNLMDWSQETLGQQISRVMPKKRAPMTVRQISRWENGENSIPFDALDAMAGLFGVSPQELVPDSPPHVRPARTPAPVRKKEPSPLPASVARRRASNL